jgi:hypothetical protein
VARSEPTNRLTIGSVRAPYPVATAKTAPRTPEGSRLALRPPAGGSQPRKTALSTAAGGGSAAGGADDEGGGVGDERGGVGDERGGSGDERGEGGDERGGGDDERGGGGGGGSLDAGVATADARRTLSRARRPRKVSQEGTLGPMRSKTMAVEIIVRQRKTVARLRRRRPRDEGSWSLAALEDLMPGWGAILSARQPKRALGPREKTDETGMQEPCPLGIAYQKIGFERGQENSRSKDPNLCPSPISDGPQISAQTPRGGRSHVHLPASRSAWLMRRRQSVVRHRTQSRFRKRCCPRAAR